MSKVFSDVYQDMPLSPFNCLKSIPSDLQKDTSKGYQKVPKRIQYLVTRECENTDIQLRYIVYHQMTWHFLQSIQRLSNIPAVHSRKYARISFSFPGIPYIIWLPMARWSVAKSLPTIIFQTSKPITNTIQSFISANDKLLPLNNKGSTRRRL